MTKKLTILAIGVILFGIAAFAFSGQMNFPVTSSAQNKAPEAPDNVVYRHLFRHVAALKAKADELERQGKDAGNLRRFFKHKASLSDDEAQVLDQIAAQCAAEIKGIDERARPIIEAYKAQYPNGQVPHGQLPLPPPAELGQLEQERDSLVLRRRDELQAAFGAEAFARFNNFVKNKIAPNVNQVSAKQ